MFNKIKFKMPAIQTKLHRHSDKKENIDYGYDQEKIQLEQSHK